MCAGALISAAVDVTAADLPVCPLTIESAQDAKNIPQGWTGQSYSGRQRFQRLTFKLATDPGELRPDDEKTVSGKRMLAWEVSGMEKLLQVCEYSGTLATLSRPVPGKVSRCEVTLADGKPGAPVLSAKCE
jgi:hypothetical protein